MDMTRHFRFGRQLYANASNLYSRSNKDNDKRHKTQNKSIVVLHWIRSNIDMLAQLFQIEKNEKF